VDFRLESRGPGIGEREEERAPGASWATKERGRAKRREARAEEEEARAGRERPHTAGRRCVAHQP